MDDLEVIYVRRCTRCRVTKPAGKFGQNKSVCSTCSGRSGGTHCRSITITPAGRELLAQWHNDEAAAA